MGVANRCFRAKISTALADSRINLEWQQFCLSAAMWVQYRGFLS